MFSFFFIRDLVLLIIHFSLQDDLLNLIEIYYTAFSFLVTISLHSNGLRERAVLGIEIPRNVPLDRKSP